jgi:hypothetical protein
MACNAQGGRADYGPPYRNHPYQYQNVKKVIITCFYGYELTKKEKKMICDTTAAAALFAASPLKIKSNEIVTVGQKFSRSKGQ